MQSFESGDIVLPPQTPTPVAPAPSAPAPFSAADTIPYATAGVKTRKVAPVREGLWPAIGWWKHTVVATVLAAIIGMAFANSYQSGMTLDNKYIIEEYYKAVLRGNPEEPGPKSWTQVWQFFKNDYWWPKGISGLYRPLTSLSYWFDYVVLTGKAPKVDQHGNVIKVINGKPIGDLSWADYAAVPAKLNTDSYHTINLLVHWTNAVLIYLVSLSLTKRLWPSAFIAALFALHPITTETVTNIIGRADMFAAIAVFGGLLLYMRSRQNTDSWALPWLVGLALMTAFGVFSKESAAALALVAIVYDVAFNWRRDNEQVKGLLPLILHGLAYLGMIGAMLGLPLLASQASAEYKLADGLPMITRIAIASVAVLAGVGQYLAMRNSSREIRWASLGGSVVTIVIASILVPFYPVLAAAGIVGYELVRGTLTTDNPRFKVVAHAALYLPLFFALLAVPIAAMYVYRSNGWDVVYDSKTGSALKPEWIVWYLRFPAAILAFACGMFMHLVTIRGDRLTRAIGLMVVALAAIVASFHSYWMGILLCLIVAMHEVILGSLTPQTPEYRRDWKLIWHRFAIGYLAMIPALVAMFAVRAWVFANATPPEEPFLDNPIRGIWKVAALHLPSFDAELAKKPLLGMTYLECKMTAVKIMGKLLVLLTWPQNLCSDYSYSQIPNFSFTFRQGWEDYQTVVSLLVLIGIGFAAYKLYSRSRPAFFMICFFFAAALPTSNFAITIGSVMAERFMYLPLAGFTGIVVLGFFALFKKIFQSLQVYDEDDFPWHSVIPAVMLTLVLVAYGIRTHLRNPVWTSDRTLWEDAILTSTKSFRCYQSLAFALYEEGMLDNVPARNVDRMIKLDEEGVRLVDGLPYHLNSSRMYLHLGMYYQLKADNLCTPTGNGISIPAEANQYYLKSVDILERGIKIDRSFNELNQAKEVLRGDPPETITDAGLGPIYGTLAMSYARLGRPDLAMQRVWYGIQLDPTDSDNYARLGIIQVGAKNYEEAAVAMIQSILLDHNRQDVWKLLPSVYATLGVNTAILVDQLGAPRLNTNDAKMNYHLMLAYRNFIRYFLRAHRYQLAEDTRRDAIQKYGWPPEVFDSLFEEEIPTVTPDGPDYERKHVLPARLLRKK